MSSTPKIMSCVMCHVHSATDDASNGSDHLHNTHRISTFGSHMASIGYFRLSIVIAVAYIGCHGHTFLELAVINKKLSYRRETALAN